jgi:hypothetical protein
MSNVNHAVDLLITAAEEYAPRKADGLAHLQDLDLFIEVRELQSMESNVLAVFISEVTATAQARQPGITITCVGWAADMPSAIGDAITQWAIGVLPVLARWRGKHSCVATSRQVETRGGPFDWLAGPLIVRGDSQEDSPTDRANESLSDPLLAALRTQRPVQRLHWLELYCCKRGEGAADATCRLDNRNWRPGRDVLLAIASAWAPTPAPLHSARQFAMLLPTSGDTQRITQPTFFSWLFGRG